MCIQASVFFFTAHFCLIAFAFISSVYLDRSKRLLCSAWPYEYTNLQCISPIMFFSFSRLSFSKLAVVCTPPYTLHTLKRSKSCYRLPNNLLNYLMLTYTYSYGA